MTALARYTVGAEAMRELSPAAVLARLNAAMIAKRGRDRFLSAVQVTFRLVPGGVEGRLATAGHPPALVRRADGGVHRLGRAGIVLGVVNGVELVDVPFRLAPGDLLLLYTDGAIETRPRMQTLGVESKEFGEDVLRAVLSNCRGFDAAATLAHLTGVLDVHSEGWAGDDTALLAIRVPPGLAPDTSTAVREPHT